MRGNKTYGPIVNGFNCYYAAIEVAVVWND